MSTYADLLLARRGNDPVALVFEDQTFTWREVVQECANRTPLLAPGTHVGLLVEDLMFVSAVVPRIDPSVTSESRLFLLFTSGSTGAPICSQGRYRRLAEASVGLFSLTRDDVLYQSMPMFHGNALMTNRPVGSGRDGRPRDGR